MATEHVFPTFLQERFSDPHFVAAGGYGAVFRVTDERSDKGSNCIAVKVSKFAEDPLRKRAAAREIDILMTLIKHPSIIKIRDAIFMEHGLGVAITMEYMPAALNTVLSSPQRLTEEQRVYLLYQLFSAVHYMHSANVVHRDLTPRNILVDECCNLKVCDFGQARILRREAIDGGEEDLSDYVTTRWYRAPEITLSPRGYNVAVDMWSLGCILMEFYMRRALFPARSSEEHLQRVFEFNGTVPLDAFSSPSVGVLTFLRKLPTSERTDISAMLTRVMRSADETFPASMVDLANSLLQIDTRERIDAAHAFRHEYFRSMQDDEVSEYTQTFQGGAVSDFAHRILGFHL